MIITPITTFIFTDLKPALVLDRVKILHVIILFRHMPRFFIVVLVHIFNFPVIKVFNCNMAGRC